ncbi:MAG: histidine--tRNA ligase [Thermoguttaceae bacterium]
MITPRTLKGFRDFLPETMLPRESLIEAATQVFRSFGFAPIDTPALEYIDILLGKGSDETDKQLYRFQDHGGRDVGLRFDLTIPLARFTAQHFAELPMPFKRYHFGRVWRGENTQAGRYREFMQCDFDTIGTKSILSDVETALVINELMERIDLKSKKPFNRFKIHVNNRLILTGMLEKYDILDKSTPILRSLDKLGKIGPESVLREMTEQTGLTSEQASAILELTAIQSTNHGKNDSILQSLNRILSGNATGEEGVAKLAELLEGVTGAGVSEDRIVIDVSIARGLDYYTGTIYETFLDELPSIGSVCSGGRYDNLAGLYTKQELPGVGASLGLDRLLAALESLNMLEVRSTPSQAILLYFVAEKRTEYLALAQKLRKKGAFIEFFPEPKKLAQQLKYADRKGFPFALIIGENEWENGTCQVKNLQTGESQVVPQMDICSYIV